MTEELVVDYQLVHKIVFFDASVKMCICMGKFVDRCNMDDIQFFLGVVPKDNPEEVTLEEMMELKETGIPFTEGTFDVFLKKDDYDEHDLLGDDDKSVAVRLT